MSSQLGGSSGGLQEQGTERPGDANNMTVSFLAGPHVPLE